MHRSRGPVGNRFVIWEAPLLLGLSRPKGTNQRLFSSISTRRAGLIPSTNNLVSSSTRHKSNSTLQCKTLITSQVGRHYRSHGEHSSSGMVGTTILCVKKGEDIVVIGDGQVSLGSTVVKPNARKVRQIRPGIIAGFAGSTADAFTLFERLEEKLDQHQGQLLRSCVDLAKSWRTDKYLRRLEAVMIVADKSICLTVTGNGDVVEPHDGLIGIGSGGTYALACARGLIDMPGLDAETIALKAMNVAADLCIYTNHNFLIEKIKADVSYVGNKPSILSVPESGPTTSTVSSSTSSSPSPSPSTDTNKEGASNQTEKEGERKEKQEGGSSS